MRPAAAAAALLLGFIRASQSQPDHHCPSTTLDFHEEGELYSALVAKPANAANDVCVCATETAGVGSARAWTVYPQYSTTSRGLTLGLTPLVKAGFERMGLQAFWKEKTGVDFQSNNLRYLGVQQDVDNVGNNAFYGMCLRVTHFTSTVTTRTTATTTTTTTTTTTVTGTTTTNTVTSITLSSTTTTTASSITVSSTTTTFTSTTITSTTTVTSATLITVTTTITPTTSTTITNTGSTSTTTTSCVSLNPGGTGSVQVQCTTQQTTTSTTRPIDFVNAEHVFYDSSHAGSDTGLLDYQLVWVHRTFGGNQYFCVGIDTEDTEDNIGADNGVRKAFEQNFPPLERLTWDQAHGSSGVEGMYVKELCVNPTNGKLEACSRDDSADLPGGIDNSFYKYAAGIAFTQLVLDAIKDDMTLYDSPDVTPDNWYKELTEQSDGTNWGTPDTPKLPTSNLDAFKYLFTCSANRTLQLLIPTSPINAVFTCAPPETGGTGASSSPSTTLATPTTTLYSSTALLRFKDDSDDISPGRVTYSLGGGSPKITERLKFVQAIAQLAFPDVWRMSHYGTRGADLAFKRYRPLLLAEPGRRASNLELENDFTPGETVVRPSMAVPKDFMVNAPLKPIKSTSCFIQPLQSATDLSLTCNMDWSGIPVPTTLKPQLSEMPFMPLRRETGGVSGRLTCFHPPMISDDVSLADSVPSGSATRRRGRRTPTPALQGLVTDENVAYDKNTGYAKLRSICHQDCSLSTFGTLLYQPDRDPCMLMFCLTPFNGNQCRQQNTCKEKRDGATCPIWINGFSSDGTVSLNCDLNVLQKFLINPTLAKKLWKFGNVICNQASGAGNSDSKSPDYMQSTLAAMVNGVPDATWNLFEPDFSKDERHCCSGSFEKDVKISSVAGKLEFDTAKMQCYLPPNTDEEVWFEIGRIADDFNRLTSSDATAAGSHHGFTHLKSPSYTIKRCSSARQQAPKLQCNSYITHKDQSGALASPSASCVDSADAFSLEEPTCKGFNQLRNGKCAPPFGCVGDGDVQYYSDKQTMDRTDTDLTFSTPYNYEFHGTTRTTTTGTDTSATSTTTTQLTTAPPAGVTTTVTTTSATATSMTTVFIPKGQLASPYQLYTRMSKIHVPTVAADDFTVFHANFLDWSSRIVRFSDLHELLTGQFNNYLGLHDHVPQVYLDHHHLHCYPAIQTEVTLNADYYSYKKRGTPSERTVITTGVPAVSVASVSCIVGAPAGILPPFIRDLEHSRGTDVQRDAGITLVGTALRPVDIKLIYATPFTSISSGPTSVTGTQTPYASSLSDRCYRGIDWEGPYGVLAVNGHKHAVPQTVPVVPDPQDNAVALVYPNPDPCKDGAKTAGSHYVSRHNFNLSLASCVADKACAFLLPPDPVDGTAAVPLYATGNEGQSRSVAVVQPWEEGYRQIYFATHFDTEQTNDDFVQKLNVDHKAQALKWQKAYYTVLNSSVAPTTTAPFQIVEFNFPITRVDKSQKGMSENSAVAVASVAGVVVLIAVAIAYVVIRRGKRRGVVKASFRLMKPSYI